MTAKWDVLEKHRSDLLEMTDEANHIRAIIFNRQRDLKRLEAKMKLLRSQIAAELEDGDA